jgi:hypothetical protein
LRESLRAVFRNESVSTALFYFAGHGSLTESGAMLATQDAQLGDDGIFMREVLDLANASPARERIVILDCCHAGAIDKLIGSNVSSSLNQGVSILAASRASEPAMEENGRGVFTSLVCEGLSEVAADVVGWVNLAGLYSSIVQVLDAFEQRPLMKANLAHLEPLRKCSGNAVSIELVRQITDYFPDPNHAFQLDPSFEPSATPEADKTPAGRGKERIFGILQKYRAAQLVAPDGEDHMYYAAVNSKTCRLTPLGRLYWRRVQKKLL